MRTPARTADGSGGPRAALAALALVALVVAAYLPLRTAGFIWDDDTFLLENPRIHAADGLLRFWATTESPDYFPLTSTTLWIEWRLWGERALGYHVVNALLHAGTSVLLWRVLLRLRVPAAWLAAAVFAVHPVNVESVAWITERKNTLSMFLATASVLAYLRHEDDAADGAPARGTYATSLALFVLALLAKTAVVTVPVVLLATAWLRRGRVGRADLRRAAPFLAASLLLGLVTVWFQTHRAISEDAELVRDDGFASRLAIAGRAVWFYLGKAAFPVRLSFVYPRWTADASDPLAYAPVVLLAAALAACWRFRATWGRACLVALGSYVLLLLPVLGFVNVYFMRYSLVADHWQYVAIAAPVALAAGGIAAALARRGEGALRAGRWAAAVVLAVLVALSRRECAAYADAETLWRTTVRRNPDSSIAHHNLGVELVKRGHPADALPHYERAIELEPRSAEVRSNLGHALLELGRTEEALAPLREAIALRPSHSEAHYNLGVALARSGDDAGALAAYRRAASLRPGYADAHHNAGVVLLGRGDADGAAEEFGKAVAARPGHAGARHNLGALLLRRGRAEEAIPHLRAAVEARPDLVAARSALGLALLARKDYAGAVRECAEAVRRGPAVASARINLATVLARTGNGAGAAAEYRAALEIEPGAPAAVRGLAWVLATAPDPAVRKGAEALALAQAASAAAGGDDAACLDAVAAAFAELGRFADAAAAADRAADAARRAGRNDLAEEILARRDLYRAGRPFRETGPGGPR